MMSAIDEFENFLYDRGLDKRSFWIMSASQKDQLEQQFYEYIRVRDQKMAQQAAS